MQKQGDILDSLSFFVKVVERAMQIILLFGIGFLAVSTFKYLPREVRRVMSCVVTMLFFFTFFRQSAISLSANAPKELNGIISLFCLFGITAVFVYYCVSEKYSKRLFAHNTQIQSFEQRIPDYLTRDFSYTPYFCKASFLKLSPVNLN